MVEGTAGRVCVAGAVGGGIFAKTAKTPPLQSGVCGDAIAIRIAIQMPPIAPPCAYHATHGLYGFYNDAARRVATVFEKWNFLIETDLRARRENPPPKRLNPYGPFAAVSLLEYGGLKPILPFLGGRSGAACRVVILPFAVPVDAPMGTNGNRRCIPATISPQCRL